MNIYVGQIYIQVGANFPFSHHMQIFLSEKLSELISLTPEFAKAFGADFALIARISARKELLENEIKGPGVYRRRKCVEYSLFLPHGVIAHSPEGRKAAVDHLLDGIHAILVAAELDPNPFLENRASIAERLCTDPIMLDGPWPSPTP